jgi:iron complex transport system substrate-binding protein
MKIVSLLPSATEIVFALGLGDSLVGVTDECDYPPEAVTKPVVSRSALPQGRPLSAREIDEAVRGRLDAKEPLYFLDTDLLRRERPDVILTQDLCRVCAVPSGQVQQALEKIGLPDAKVLSLDPNTLEEVIAQIDVVGKLLERPEEAAKLTESLRMRVAKVKEVATRLPMLNVFCLEWSDPPFAAGHWVPEMVEAAAGVNLLSEKGGPSTVVTHRQIRDANPEAIVFMPCGYYLEEAEEEAAPILTHPELRETSAVRNGNVFAVDATSYFSRPGPRIVDGLEVLAWALHPDAYPVPPANTISRVG